MPEDLKPVHVTLIDDSEDDVLMMKEAISESSPLCLHSVFYAGMDALEHMVLEKDPSKLPNLIFLDINMPRINGFEVLRKLKTHTHLRLIPTILLTTSVREEDVYMAYALGAASYLQKPFDFEELINATRRVADYWSRASLPNVNIRPSTR